MNRLVLAAIASAYLCTPAFGKTQGRAKCSTKVRATHIKNIHAVNSNTPNISGTWHGVVLCAQQNYAIKLYLQQNSQTVGGVLTSHGPGGIAIHHLKGSYYKQQKRFRCSDYSMNIASNNVQFTKSPISHYTFWITDRGQKLAGIAKPDANTTLPFTLSKDNSASNISTKIALIPVKNVNPKEIMCVDLNGKTKIINLQAAYVPIPEVNNTEGIDQDTDADTEPIVELENHMLALINKDRTTNHASTISLNSKLSDLARNYAEYMLKNKFFGHMDPKGRNPMERAREMGIICDVYENIAFQGRRPTYKDSELIDNIESALMAEAPNEFNHRYNILLPKHKCVGIGIANTRDHLMVVEEFADEDPNLLSKADYYSAF